MKRSNLLPLLAVFAAFVSQAAEKNTRERLNDYGKGLSEAWTKFNLDSQKTTRQQTIQDLTSLFTREINAASAPPGQTIAQCTQAFLRNLEKANDFFRVEKMKSERASYLRGCSLVLKREVLQSTDYTAARTTQQCYEIFSNLIQDGAESFVQEKNKDLRQEVLTGAQSMFTDILNKATVPEGIDHAEQMDKNITEARKQFPITTKVLQQKNQQVLTALENAAKLVKQRSIRR